MFESTGLLKTALWRLVANGLDVFLELQSSGTTSRLSPKIGPVIGLSVAVGCQRSGGPANHPGERDHFASESEMSPQIGLNGAVGGPRSGGLPEAPEEGNSGRIVAFLAFHTPGTLLKAFTHRRRSGASRILRASKARP
ncbi:unnamed protein product [Boreogadus saida]